MFKRLIVATFIVIFLSTGAFSMTLQEGEKAFSDYIRFSNTYDKKLKDMYTKDSKIIRVILRADKTSYEKTLSVAMYKTMLSYYGQIALWQGYKNEYTDISYKKVGKDVVVSCSRHPSTSTDSLPAKIVFTKNDFDRVVIKEEKFHTKASFLIR